MSGRIDVHFVCKAMYHDTDFARLEILKLLHENPNIRVSIAEDYSDEEAISNADALITYTCNIQPTESQQQTLKRFLQSGKRWFALHATNSIIEFLEDGRVNTPRSAPLFMELLGSQFIAHPPLMEFDVKPSQPDHPLVEGIEPFKVTDELYLSEYHGEVIPLLETRYVGKAAEGFVEDDWPEDKAHLVMYLHPYDKGEVLYYTPGHCRSTYDMQPLMDEYPELERCAWEVPEHYELLRRGIHWMVSQ